MNTLFQLDTKRLSVHQAEEEDIEQEQQQQQIALILAHLEGQQLDQQQLNVLLTQLEGLSLEQQQILVKQLSSQQLSSQQLSSQQLTSHEGGEEDDLNAAEPIYQNQGQIIVEEGTEPIYQNLPLPKLDEVKIMKKKFNYYC